MIVSVALTDNRQLLGYNNRKWDTFIQYQGAMKTWKLYGRHAKNGQIFIWMNACVLFHTTQLIFTSKTKTTILDQINRVSKIIKHRTRWNERTTAFLVHSQQRNTGALLSPSELVEVHGPVIATQAAL